MSWVEPLSEGRFRAEFSVTGKDKAALEHAAAEVVASLLDDGESAVVTIAASPLVNELGKAVPSTWEGQVGIVA